MITSLLFRFFLMYLINKDETEHTGQVRLRYLWVCLFFPSFSVSNQPGFFFCFVCFSVLGVIRVEDVPGALLGLFPRW